MFQTSSCSGYGHCCCPPRLAGHAGPACQSGSSSSLNASSLLLFVYHVLRFVQSIRFFPSLCASLYSYLSLGIHIMDRGWLANPGELANCGPGAGWQCGGTRTLDVLTLASSFAGAWSVIYHELLSSLSELKFLISSPAEASPIVSLSHTSRFLTSSNVDRFSSIIRSSKQEPLPNPKSPHHSLPADTSAVARNPILRSLLL